MFAGSIVPPAAVVSVAPEVGPTAGLAVLVGRENGVLSALWKQEHAAVFFQLVMSCIPKAGMKALAYGEVPAAFSPAGRRAQRQ